MNFMGYLDEKPASEMSGKERYVYEKLMSGDNSWLPYYATQSK